MNLSDNQIISIYGDVEQSIKEKITNCKSKEEFILTITSLQLYAQRILGVLLFNALKAAPSIPFDKQFQTITNGIKHEYDLLVESEKADPEGLTSVDAKFEADNAPVN